MMSMKNQMLGGSVEALGLGDMLAKQLADQEEERKKKLIGGRQTEEDPLSSYGAATRTLFGGVSGSSSRMNLGL